MRTKKVIIMGAAGRDFHNFNTVFRNHSKYNVVAFTATQIPNISGRKYPKVLAGKGYPNGIPIFPEEKLPSLIRKHNIDQVVFSYSDVTHDYVMQKAERVIATGADFVLFSQAHTQLSAKVPVIAVCAVRTGCGKSQISRAIAANLKKQGKRVAVIRHPMPYGDLKKQIVQKFATYGDLTKHKTTIEEREEYEPYVKLGIPIYAGVDYKQILEKAQKNADVLIWDGGNNDLPFYKPDVHIVVADPLRPGHELQYYPGEANAINADVVVINKVNTAKKADIAKVEKNIKSINPKARILKAKSNITTEEKVNIKNKKVLVVEDGPTTTHGSMGYGAGFVFAKKQKAKPIQPEKYAVGSIKKAFKHFKQLKHVVPALGYGKKQMQELQSTINKAPVDYVIAGTPIDLSKVLKSKKKIIPIRYESDEATIKKLMALIKLRIK